MPFHILIAFKNVPLTKQNKEYIESNFRRYSAKHISKKLNANRQEVQGYMQTLKSKPKSEREKLFKIITLSIPFVFLILLEVGLRLFNYGGNLDLFIQAPGRYTNYYMCNPEVGRRYFFHQQVIPDPPNDLFLKEKPGNGYRIFTVGGSTTAGYPYGNNLMFSRILGRRLADAFPDKHIEVINTAMTAVNTFTILDFLDEILQQGPDAVLIYSGHNEFYGALGAASNESLGKFRGFVKGYLKLQRFKTFLLVRKAVNGLKNLVSGKDDTTAPTATLMERIVGEQTIPFQGDLYELGRRQYEGNLRDILSKLQAADVNVLLSDLVSNVRGLKPFVSTQADSFPRADRVYESAQEFESRGDFEEARKFYILAKDLDGLRFRASEEFNAIIQKVASEFGLPVAPMQARFEVESPNGIVGDNLMLEHLHPNADGYLLMADVFFNAMHKNGFISPDWDSTRIKPFSHYQENWGMTELDLAYADIRIRILKGGWPFKPKSAPNRSLANYQPANVVDSVALKIKVKKGYGLKHGHRELAEYYKQRGEWEKAFQEYRATAAISPLDPLTYLDAAEALIEGKQLDRSIPFLETSLGLKETAYGNKWLGQVLLNNGETKEALPYLEKAVKLAPKDAQLIYNLSGAYALNKRYEDAKRSLEKLAVLNPSFPGAGDLKRQLDKL